MRLSTLAVWSPTVPYSEGDQVLYNGVIHEVKSGQSVGEPAPGANNETPEGQLVSQWGLISQLGSVGSEQWTSGTTVVPVVRNALTVLDIPQFTQGVYYFATQVGFGAVESQEIAPILSFRAQNIGDSIDNVQEPIDSLLTNIDDLGDPFAAASTSVRMEISTTNEDPDDINSVWSNYTTFTQGSYNFRGSRFRLVINTSNLGTQVTVTEAGIETNLPARTINNISPLSWSPEDYDLNRLDTDGMPDPGPGYEDVIFNNTTASGPGSSFFSGGGNLGAQSAEPSLSIVSENIFPGEYFVITNRDSANPTANNFENGQEAEAPLPHLGFRIRYYRVGSTLVCVDSACVTTPIDTRVSVPAAPDIGPTGNDGLIADKTLNFDYQATGY